MKKITLILCVLVSTNSLALDFNKYIENLKDKTMSLLGVEGESTSGNSEKWVLPTIPNIAQKATSVEVYDKSGILYTQGGSFTRLSDQEKRKYRLAFIKELFSVTKNAEVKDEELRSKLNLLEQGGSREGIYRSIVLGQDYLMLESLEEKSSDKLGEFVVRFGEMYLGRKFDRAQIKNINLWGVKRIIVEKTLETMDAFNTDGKDLYTWYAMLSASLATNYQNVFSSTTRRNSTTDFHYKWVQKVPYQQIKSEMIIKLHKVMNYLQ